MRREKVSNIAYERIKNNLEKLKLTKLNEIIDNYLEMALKEETNIVDILDYLLDQETKFKDKRASEI